MSKKISVTVSDNMFRVIRFLAEKDGRSLSGEANFMLQQHLVKEEGNHYHPKVKELLMTFRVVEEGAERPGRPH